VPHHQKTSEGGCSLGAPVAIRAICQGGDTPTYPGYPPPHRTRDRQPSSPPRPCPESLSGCPVYLLIRSGWGRFPHDFGRLEATPQTHVAGPVATRSKSKRASPPDGRSDEAARPVAEHVDGTPPSNSSLPAGAFRTRGRYPKGAPSTHQFSTRLPGPLSIALPLDGTTPPAPPVARLISALSVPVLFSGSEPSRSLVALPGAWGGRYTGAHESAP
jgi:hypothetical protein